MNIEGKETYLILSGWQIKHCYSYLNKSLIKTGIDSFTYDINHAIEIADRKYKNESFEIKERYLKIFGWKIQHIYLPPKNIKIKENYIDNIDQAMEINYVNLN